MRLREKPRDEDLEVVTYWVDSRSRSWPVDGDDNPIHPDTDQPLEFDKNERLDPADHGFDPPERLRFWIKMLQGRETNEITAAVIKTRASRTQGRRRRRTTGQIESEVQYDLAVKMKLQAAIVKWEGIEDDQGQPAPINDKYLGLLPSWLQDDLVDTINEMSSLSEEEMGE